MNTGAEWDTREAYLEFTGKSARGVTNIDVVDSVYCQELPTRSSVSEEINCTLRQPDGTYYRTKSYGQPGPWWINFNGKRMKPLLAKGRPQRPGAPCSTAWSPPICSPAAVPSGRGGLRYPHGRFPYHPRRGGHHLHGRHQPPLQQPFRHELQHMDVPRRHRRRRSHEPARRRGTRQHRIPAHDRGAPQLQRRRAQRPLSGMGAVLINAKGEAFMDRYHPPRHEGPPLQDGAGRAQRNARRPRPRVHGLPGHRSRSQKHLIATLSCDKRIRSRTTSNSSASTLPPPMEVDTSEGMQGGPTKSAAAASRSTRTAAPTCPASTRAATAPTSAAA